MRIWQDLFFLLGNGNLILPSQKGQGTYIDLLKEGGIQRSTHQIYFESHKSQQTLKTSRSSYSQAHLDSVFYLSVYPVVKSHHLKLGRNKKLRVKYIKEK